MTKLKMWFTGFTTGALIARVATSLVCSLIVGYVVARLLEASLAGAGVPTWVTLLACMLTSGVVGNRLGRWFGRLGRASSGERARRFTEDDL